MLLRHVARAATATVIAGVPLEADMSPNTGVKLWRLCPTLTPRPCTISLSS